MSKTDKVDADKAILEHPFIERSNFLIRNPPPTIPTPAAGSKMPPHIIAEIEGSIVNWSCKYLERGQ